MAGLGGFDAGFGGAIPPNLSVFTNIAMDGDEYVRCVCCGFGGCDVRVTGCGCTMHSVGGIFYVFSVLCLCRIG